MEGVKPNMLPHLGNLNGPAMAHWLVECANRRGLRCGRTAEDKWRRNWRVWSEFCALRSVAAFPIERTYIEAFVIDCGVRGRRRDTVTGYLNTLKAVISSVDATDPMETEEGKASLQRLMVIYFPEPPTEAPPAAEPLTAIPAPPAAAPTDVKQATPGKPFLGQPRRRQTDRQSQQVEPGRGTIGRMQEPPQEPVAAPNAPALLDQEPRVNADRAATLAVEGQPDPLVSFISPSRQHMAEAARGGRYLPPKPRNARMGSKPPPLYELPEDYGRCWWTHGMRLKEQARVTWAARYAMRERTPERFKLLRLAVRELELADDGYSEIGASVLRGCIGGAGGFRKVAGGIGVPAESLRAAFARDEVPAQGIVRKVVAHLLKSNDDQA